MAHACTTLDRAPNGRGEGDTWQLWIRRRDEYGSN